MKHWFAFACMLCLCTLGLCEDKVISTSLTPKDIAEGWVHVFDGNTTFGLLIEGDGRVHDGQLVLGGTNATSLRPTTNFGNCKVRIERVHGSAGFQTGPTSELHPWLNWSVDPETPGKGSPFPIRVPARTFANFKRIDVQPTGLRPLFNGKDLTGWKRFEANPMRAKSEFSVTPEGWIHLKNGPGDLQTVEQFADFVLQVECRTNGPHLNSGVFFRCIPNLYQQGYEAQIHNHYTPEPKREYTIEEYDPHSNELKGKTKVKATAVDYGTGAIYRRIPARGEAAKDGEWFTMTVVASGRHLATWVNGVQQTDWIDNRPINNNARNGCRLEKGAISLQGHDKTTDLYFRNIRIAELKKGK